MKILFVKTPQESDERKRRIKGEKERKEVLKKSERKKKE